MYPVMLLRFVSVRELIREQMYMYIYHNENRVRIVYAHYITLMRIIRCKSKVIRTNGKALTVLR